ncbi:MAG: aminotransferase class III-fold pyridoxal phosphate-dependent enzyme [Candidatus Heimdallarchaeota archaeon]
MNHSLKRPEFSEEEAQAIVMKLYGVNGIAQEFPSERDQNFYLRASDGLEFVLKIASTLEKREILDFQNQALIHLSSVASGIAPRIILTRNNNLLGHYKRGEENYFIRLLTYLPGKVLARINPHHEELVAKFGHFIGELTKGLSTFSHPSSEREFHWDLRHAHTVIERYKEYIQLPERKALLEYFLTFFENNTKSKVGKLRKSVIHNDANDFNIIVNYRPTPFSYDFGIIDFGDMVKSCTVFELAVAIAYLMLGKENPIGIASVAVTGFHSVFPLTDLEVECLFIFICLRLCLSVTISAYQRKIDPDNEYLSISEDLAWKTLYQLKEIHPEFAHISFRIACKMIPSLKTQSIGQWLARTSHTSIIEYNFSNQPHIVFDLSVNSLEFSSFYELQNKDRLQRLIYDRMKESNINIGIGRHNEPRLYYTIDLPSSVETPTIHLGYDLFLISRIPIYSPADGQVYWKQGHESSDFTSLFILKHILDLDKGELTYFTIYRNLEADSIKNLEIGDEISQGEHLGYMGKLKGETPLYFLHFQLSTCLFGTTNKFPFKIPANQKKVWLSVCLDPNIFLRIPDESFPQDGLSMEEILMLRKQKIGPSLSISYINPLHIVRGYGQYLYDQNARSYLDAVNNVPHVGHNHPKVVDALRRQSIVLNTNTRYLHENLVRYALRLCATFPDPLKVCFFVNSGSEANELALRLARTYTKQHDIIVIDHAYHGNTGELINISPYKHEGPGGQGSPPYVHKVSMPDIFRGLYRAGDPEASKKYATEVEQILVSLQGAGRGPAAFICESLPGVGGQIVFPKGYLEEVYKHIRSCGGVCIADEVQVGFGRVGSHFWGFELQNVVPDIVTLGKPMGNGHPIGAVVTTPEIARAFDNGMEYFTTTGGNPVSCAVGLAVLEVIQTENLQKNAREIGAYLKTELLKLKERFPIIGDVRGEGLFLGAELVINPEKKDPAPLKTRYVVERMKEEGILLGFDGPLLNVIKIKPPLIFTKDNAVHLIKKLEQVLAEDYLQI